MANYTVRIVLQGGIGGTTKDLNNQLKEVSKQLKPLSVSIKIDSSSMEKVTKSTNQTTESTKKAQQQLSNYEKTLNNTIKSYRQQSLNIEDYIKKLNKAVSMQAFKQLSDEKQIRILDSLARAESNLSRIQQTRRRVTSLQQTPAENPEKQLNDYIRGLNSSLRGQRITNQEYIRETDAIINSIRRWEMADDRLRAAILRNRQQINRANRETRQQQERPIDEGRMANTITSLQQSVSRMTGGSGGRFMNPSEIDAVNSRIRALSESFRTMARPQIANEVGAIRNQISGINAAAQNAARSSLNLGDSLYQAAIKFPKM